MRLLSLLLASLTLTFALAGCFGGDDKDDDDANGDTPDGGDNGMSNNTTDEMTDLSVAVVDTPPGTPPAVYRFNPATLTAPANVTINLTVTSTMGPTGNKLNHAFVIDDVVSITGVAPGNTKNATFMISEPGEYVYYCSVPNHRAAGMQGTLTIE